MYWLSIKGVKTELVESKYSDGVALKYYLAFIVWQSLLLGAFGWPSVNLESDIFFQSLYAMVLLAPIAGVYLVLVRWGNRGEIERPLTAFISLGWIINIRMALLLSPMFIYSWYLGMPESTHTTVAYFLGLVASLLYYLGFFIWLSKVLRGLKDVAP